jgi:hypothetical protein
LRPELLLAQEGELVQSLLVALVELGVVRVDFLEVALEDFQSVGLLCLVEGHAELGSPLVEKLFLVVLFVEGEVGAGQGDDAEQGDRECFFVHLKTIINELNDHIFLS